MSTVLQWLGFIVSLFAFGFSVWAFKKSSSAEKRMLEIEEARERDRINQANKADLRARIERIEPIGGRNRKDNLIIENHGESEAREIAISIDNVPVLSHPTIPEPQEEIKQIGKKSSARYVMALTFRTGPPFEFEAFWKDDSGEPGHYKTTLTL